MDQENHTRDNYDTSSDKMRKRPPVRYDENGNPIRPKKRPPVRYDENGNPIRPKQTSLPPRSLADSIAIFTESGLAL